MIKGSQVAVTGAQPVLLGASAVPQETARSVVVKNKLGASGSVWIGGPDVDISGVHIGYELEPGESVSIDLSEGEAPYGKVASGSVTLHVIEGGL